MNVTTNITRTDLIRMNLFLVPRVRTNWIVLIILFLICLVSLLFHVAQTETEPPEIMLLTAISAGVSLTFMLLALIICIAISIILASPKTGLGEHKYKITPEGLQEDTIINSELSKWPSFDAVYKSNDLIILKKHWAALHLFPKRSFTSTEHFLDFFRTLQEKIQTTNS